MSPCPPLSGSCFFFWEQHHGKQKTKAAMKDQWEELPCPEDNLYLPKKCSTTSFKCFSGDFLMNKSLNCADILSSVDQQNCLPYSSCALFINFTRFLISPCFFCNRVKNKIFRSKISSCATCFCPETKLFSSEQFLTYNSSVSKLHLDLQRDTSCSWCYEFASITVPCFNIFLSHVQQNQQVLKDVHCYLIQYVN